MLEIKYIKDEFKGMNKDINYFSSDYENMLKFINQRYLDNCNHDLIEKLDGVLLIKENTFVLDISYFIGEIIDYSKDIILFKDKDEGKFMIYLPKEKSENIDLNFDLMQFNEFKIINSKKGMLIKNNVDYIYALKIIQKEISNIHIDEGVAIISPDTCLIGYNVKIEPNTIIYPNTIILGDTKIEKNCIIGPDTYINNSKVSEGSEVIKSVVNESEIGKNNKVGPYSHIRPNTKSEEEVKIGAFCEVKNSNIGNKTKVSHLDYVGDADLGESINVGCGVIFSNYDGKKKYRSEIGDNVFIGSNSNIISPVKVKKDSYIAASTVVTKDVEENKFVIGRKKAEVKDKK